MNDNIKTKNKVDLILGTMTFGESVFAPQAGEFINTFLAAGYRELDAAYVYNDGECERLLGEALRNEKRPYRIATKVHPRVSGRLDQNAVYTQVNESLGRLGLERVDVVYLHFPDLNTPLGYALEAMADLHSQGKFAELGLSNFPAWMVADAWHVCDRHGWVRPTVYEGIYNPLTRNAERELFLCLDRLGMRFAAYNPLCGGLLTDRYGGFGDVPTSGRFVNRPNYMNRYWKNSFFEALGVIRAACAKAGIEVAEASLRWLAYHSALSASRGDAIIIGASRPEHLRDNIAALAAGELPPDVLAAFEAAWETAKPDSPEYFTFYKG